MPKVILNRYPICIAGFILLVSVPLYAQQSLSSQISHYIKETGTNGAIWSVSVRDTTGKKIIGINDQKLVTPGSNLKLMTSAAILHALGIKYRFKTSLYGFGQRKDSVWDGDVYIVGTGDPSINGDFYQGDPLHVFDEFYEKLDSLGIKSVNGYIIANNSYFDSKPYPDGWSWNNLTSSAVPEIDALSFNNNCIDITTKAKGRIGDSPEIHWFPYNTNFVHVINEQTITPDDTPFDAQYKRILGTNTIILKSNIPQNDVEKVSITVTNPAHFFIDSFKKYLNINGFNWKGNEIVDNRMHNWRDTTKFTKLVVHRSQPVGTLIQRINKNNNNFYAEMMLKASAAKVFEAQGSTDLGIQLVGNYLASLGIDTSKVEMTDASGVSDHTLVETAGLTKFLVKIRNKKYFPVYQNSLSQASLDGTLENRFLNTPLQTKVLGMATRKMNSAAFSGYISTKKNKTLIFSIITNHFKGNWKKVTAVQDKVLSLFYNHY